MHEVSSNSYFFFFLAVFFAFFFFAFLAMLPSVIPKMLAQCKSTFDLHELRIHHNCKIDTPRFEQGKRASPSRDHGEVAQPRGAEDLAGGGRQGDRTTVVCAAVVELRQGTTRTILPQVASVGYPFAAIAVIARAAVAIVGIRTHRIYSLLDQSIHAQGYYARFNHHRGRVWDRSCGRAPAGRAG